MQANKPESKNRLSSSSLETGAREEGFQGVLGGLITILDVLRHLEASVGTSGDFGGLEASSSFPPRVREF